MSDPTPTVRTMFWVNTVSREHVLLGVEGGFTQAGHGRSIRLKQLAVGDGLVFYSPRTAMRSGAALQEFTAIGLITGTEPYQVEISEDFRPWRRDVEFSDARPAPIRPLIESLAFLPDKARWGFPFRRGLFRVEEADFRLIAEAMGASWPVSAVT